MELKTIEEIKAEIELFMKILKDKRNLLAELESEEEAMIMNLAIERDRYNGY